MQRTLQSIEDDIRFKYDLETFTSRFPSATVISLINASYRKLRERLTSEGSELFLSSIEYTETATGRTPWRNGTLLTMSGLGLQFQVVTTVAVEDSGRWLTLRHTTNDEVDQYDGNRTGMPMVWCVSGLNQESGGSAQWMQIVVWPSLDISRTFRMRGLKTWPDASANTPVWDDMCLFDYVVADVGVTLMARDDDAQLYQARLLERDSRYREIQRAARRREPTSAIRANVRMRGGR